MFKNFSSLQYTYSKSVHFRSFGIRKVIIQNKNPVTSIHYPLNISKRTIYRCIQDYKYLRQFLKKSKIFESDLFKKNLSTSSCCYNEKKGPDSQNEPNQDKNFDKNTIAKIIIIWTLVYIVIVRLITGTKDLPDFFITWEEFKYEMLAKGEVEKIILSYDRDIVTILLHKGAVVRNQVAPREHYYLKTPEIAKFEDKVREAERQLGISPKDSIPIEYRYIDGLGSFLFFSILLFSFWLFLSKFVKVKLTSVSDFMSISKAKFTLVDPLAGQGKGVKFSDVAGLQEAKVEIMEFVDYLKKPEHYRTLGAKVPKGALLLGPPGCGKTLLAKAVATEANVPFLSMNGSEFIEMIGGLGAARVRDLFKEANKRIPCIVYIDEIDAIGKKRGADSFQRGEREGEQTLNQLLVEMDGMVSNEGVVLLASTNRAEVLDQALLRPGRFDRQILIDLPTFEERRQIFEQHLKGIHLEHQPSHYSRRMAHLTPGFSGADIANVCNEAALHAARVKKAVVMGDDLEYAVERVVGGTEKRSSAMTKEEKEMFAYYEAGRALVGWLSPYGEALLKITIVPRTESPSGWTQFSEGDKFLYSKEELMGKMCISLGGRVALSLVFNKVTTGAEKDLKKVTRLAYAQTRKFGMNKRIGMISFDSEETDTSLQKPYSKHLSALFDQEARQLVAKVYQETLDIVKANQDKLQKLAEALLQKETLNHSDIVKILGPPSHPQKKFVEAFEFDMTMKQIAGPEPTSPRPESTKEGTSDEDKI